MTNEERALDANIQAQTRMDEGPACSGLFVMRHYTFGYVDARAGDFPREIFQGVITETK